MSKYHPERLDYLRDVKKHQGDFLRMQKAGHPITLDEAIEHAEIAREHLKAHALRLIR